MAKNNAKQNHEEVTNMANNQNGKGLNSMRYNIKYNEKRDYYYYIFQRNKFGKEKRVYGHSEQEVLEKIKEEIERRAGEEITPPDSSKVSELFDHYFKFSTENKDGKKYAAKKAVYESYIKGSEIDKNIEDITVEDMEKFYSCLKRNTRIATINIVRDLFNEISVVAQEIGCNCIDFNKAKVAASSRKINEYVLQPQEYNNILNYCINNITPSKKLLYQLLIVCMSNGLMFGETTSLLCKDLDIENGTLKVRGRAAVRTITLSEEFKQWVITQDAIGNFTPNKKMTDAELNNYIFTRKSNGERVESDYVSYGFSKVTMLCSIPRTILSRSIPKAFILLRLSQGKTEEEIAKELDMGKNTLGNYILELKTEKLL